MNKADVCRELYNAAEFHLFGAGSWPADREASGAFWKLLNDFGLTASVPDEPGTTQYTPLGLELNVELMSIFAGVVELWDIPLLLELMGHLDDEEAETIYASTSRHSDVAEGGDTGGPEGLLANSFERLRPMGYYAAEAIFLRECSVYSRACKFRVAPDDQQAKAGTRSYDDYSIQEI